MNRIQVTWILLAGIMVTAIGASVVALIINPERSDSNINEWVIVGLLTVLAAAALRGIGTRWFTSVPDDIGLAVTSGVIMRVLIAEIVWMATFVFFMFGLVSSTGLFVSLIATAVIGLLFAAPTAGRIERLQEQLTGLGAVVDLDSELRKPAQP